MTNFKYKIYIRYTLQLYVTFVIMYEFNYYI